MENTYIIKDNDGRFWTGMGWSNEYPDADLYDSRSEAIAAAKRRTKSCKVVRDYGMTTEVIIFARD